jgi:hypothetical protein
MFYRLLLLLVVLSAYTGHAQLRVQLLGERSTFLLYEPIVYNLVLANEGGTEVVLRDSADGLRPWLSFLIFNSAGEKIRRVQGKGMQEVVLQPGESKTFAVNLTPLYRLRSTGQYDVKASVTAVGGETRLTSSLRFYIGKGQEIWTDTRTFDGIERKFSLIRFIDRSILYMYARVEEPSQRLVYGTKRLGPIVGYTEPITQFDERGHLHVMHIAESRVHRHSELSPSGKLVKAEDFRQWQDFAPEFVGDGAGGLNVAKAIPVKQGKRERPKLSNDQRGL